MNDPYQKGIKFRYLVAKNRKSTKKSLKVIQIIKTWLEDFSPETKFPHQEIRWNYGILRSVLLQLL